MVKEVREIAFEIEDTLDEYKLQLRSDGRRAARICVISRFFKNLKYRHEIASQMQHLKSRIMDASQRPQRYQLNIPKQVQRSAASSSIVFEQRGNALLLEEDEVVGIDGPKKELLGWLLEADSTLKVISVVGMRGLGKTTLVKKVYDDFAVLRHFKIHAWVTVSQSFKTGELLKKIIHQIFKESKQQTPEGMESHDLKKVIKDFLRDSGYLLVLDDVWQVDACDAIKHALPKSNHGSRVILTARNEKVAKASCSDFRGEVYRLEPLSSEESWELFCTKTFQEDQCPQRLSGIAQKIIEKCHGLPLAIVAVSGVLAAKRNGSADEWEMVSRNLSGEFQSDKIPSVKRILSLSYNDLPVNLKACMLHMSMFPEDFEMSSQDLVALWTAEGFVEENEGKTLEEVADSYLNELLDRNLIIINDPLKVEWRIHDLLREDILSKAKDQNFAAVVDEETTRWPESTRRLSIHHTLGNIPDNRQRCVLRSLLVFGVNDFPLASLASDLRLLKVLDMGEANLEIFPKEITKLYHLRYLKLRGTNIREIPSTIGRLQNLQYLNLFYTSLSSLPRTILKLHQLRYLIVHSFVGFLGIGCLTRLQSLGRIEVNVEDGIDVIQELGKLTQLREVEIAKLKKEYGPALCSSLEKLKNLQRLWVTSIDEEIIDVQRISSPPKFLKHLALKGRMDKLPRWIQFLHFLTSLSLGGSQLCDNILEAIQDLPNLAFIYLEKAFQGDELCFKAEGFQNLKILFLDELQALRRVEVQKGSMPGLEQLGVYDCPSMENVPFGIDHLSKLKIVKFFNLSDDLVNKINGDGEDFRRLEHIPRVIFDH